MVVVQQGATPVRTSRKPAAVTLITMLVDDGAVEEVVFGEQGILAVGNRPVVCL
ncbi:3-hydroxyisobutyrate dehydrogenase-like beta-hydroxyacid dehydrogenase [Mycobacterium sp. URHB0021]